MGSLENKLKLVEIPKISQILFLKKFYAKNNISMNKLDEFIKDVMYEGNIGIVEQYIKCITHNIPYKQFLGKELTVEQVNELRRLLEDTIGEEGVKSEVNDRFLAIIDRIIEFNWNKSLIYQFRRFAKCKYYLTVDIMEKLEAFINEYDEFDWETLSELYNIYIKSYTVNDFIKSLNIEVVNEIRHKLDEDTVELSEYIHNIKKELESSNS